MTVQRINVSDAKALIETENISVIDIRDEMSFLAGHIEKAKRIDNQNIADFIQNTEFDEKILVCCYHGHSSLSAGAYLESQGFSEVYSLDGGMTQWMLMYPK